MSVGRTMPGALPSFTVEGTAGSHSLAAAAHCGRSRALGRVIEEQHDRPPHAA